MTALDDLFFISGEIPHVTAYESERQPMAAFLAWGGDMMLRPADGITGAVCRLAGSAAG